MYNPNNNAGGMGERITDNWINQNVPGGVNSKHLFHFNLNKIIVI